MSDNEVTWPRVQEILAGIMSRWEARAGRKGLPGIHDYYWDSPERLAGDSSMGKKFKTDPKAVIETVEPTGDLFVKRQGETPCRNPARIPHMINLLHLIWAQEGNTDMRMGQLLMNAARLGSWASDDIWNCS